MSEKGVVVTLICGTGANRQEVIGTVGVFAGKIDERSANVLRMPVDGLPYIWAQCPKHGTRIATEAAIIAAAVGRKKMHGPATAVQMSERFPRS